MMTPNVSQGLRRNRAGGREKLRDEGRCRMCLKTAAEVTASGQHVRGERLLTRHHLVPRTWWSYGTKRREERRSGWRRLRDADANIVPLCRPCHDLVESDVDGRKLLRKVLSQAEIAYCIQARGQLWFDTYYPPSAVVR